MGKKIEAFKYGVGLMNVGEGMGLLFILTPNGNENRLKERKACAEICETCKTRKDFCDGLNEYSDFTPVGYLKKIKDVETVLKTFCPPCVRKNGVTIIR